MLSAPSQDLVAPCDPSAARGFLMMMAMVALFPFCLAFAAS